MLCEAQARRDLPQMVLVRMSGLSRTTVWEALNSPDKLPSRRTVAALAKALRLDEAKLEALRRAAAGPKPPGRVGGPGGAGRPIGEQDPLDLGVHPAGNGIGRDAAAALPGYVPRAHDEELAGLVTRAAGGASGMAVLVGRSSTGKTRACWEAIQPLAELGWRLWDPSEPTRAAAALSGLAAVGPRTVVWLNDARQYLDAGEELAAAVHAVLTDPARAPVLVLGTLWPDFFNTYAQLPASGAPDPYARVRELVAGRRIGVPDVFDEAALAQARQLAVDGDRLLAAVLDRAHDGRIAQYLAGAPELLRRYHDASPAAKAVLHAAMDARRLGAGVSLPRGLLADAAMDYLRPDADDALDGDGLERALAELAKPVHGDLAPLRQVRPRSPQAPPAAGRPAGPPPPAGPLYRLADYLEQHGREHRRTMCPPASFWHAAHTRLTDAGNLRRLADAARDRLRLHWAAALYQRATDAGDASAVLDLAALRARAGDRDGADVLYRQATDAGDGTALRSLARLRLRAGDREGAEALCRQAIEDGDASVLYSLASMREELGDWAGAEDAYRQAADAGDIFALTKLAELRERAGDLKGAEALYRQAVDAGKAPATVIHVELQPRSQGGFKEVRRRSTSTVGEVFALAKLAELRDRAGDRDGAETLYRRAADAGSVEGLAKLAELRERAGDLNGAEDAYQSAADAGSVFASTMRAALRERAGDRDGAETLYRQASDAGDILALTKLAQLRERAGDLKGAEDAYRQAADAGESSALSGRAGLRERAGDMAGAEALYRQAADAGDTDALIMLARLREKAGDPDGAETLYRRAIDAGNPSVSEDLIRLRKAVEDPAEASRLSRYGLDPDGTLAAAWW